jgi:hypothetical protein
MSVGRGREGDSCSVGKEKRRLGEEARRVEWHVNDGRRAR